LVRIAEATIAVSPANGLLPNDEVCRSTLSFGREKNQAYPNFVMNPEAITTQPSGADRMRCSR